MYVKSIYITALLCFPQKPCTQVDAMIAASGHKVKYRAGLPDFVLVQYTNFGKYILNNLKSTKLSQNTPN
jgi:hypothetical protein